MKRGWMGDVGGPGCDAYEGPDDSAGDWTTCESCAGDGVVGHDCGEDTCRCLNPQENVKCDTCGGEGGWEVDEESPKRTNR